jgi:hypothetical protein
MQFNLSALQGDRITTLCNIAFNLNRFQLPETIASRALRIAGELVQARTEKQASLIRALDESRREATEREIETMLSLEKETTNRKGYMYV